MADSRPPVPGEEFDELPKDDFTPAEVTTADVAPANRESFKLPSNLKALWLLLKVQILSVWTSQRLGRRRNGKHGANGLTIAVLVFAIIGVLVMAGYLYVFGFGLATLGFAKLVPLVAVLIASLAGVAFTFAKANGVLFGYKDYDFIMSLPVKKTVIIASRVGAMYSVEMFWALITMVPLYAGYFSVMAITPLRVLAALLSVLLAPNLATSVAILLSWALTALGAKLHLKNFNTIIGGIFGMAIAVLYIVGVTSFSSMMGRDGGVSYAIINYREVIFNAANTVGAIYAPSLLVSNVFATGNVLSLLIFIVFSVGSPALVIALLAKFNDRVNALVVTQAANKKFTSTQISTKESGAFRAMVIKEFRTLFGYPAYFFNTSFGMVICVILALVVAFFGVNGFVASIVEDDVDVARLVAPIVRTIFGFMSTYFICLFTAASSTAAAVSYSMEGHSNWLMATMPVTARQVFGSKIAANMLYIVVGLLLSNGILLISGNIAFGTAVRNFIVPLCFCFFSANLGMAIDVRRPNFDWASVTEVTKRGMSVMVSSLVSVFGSMIVLGVNFVLFALPSFVSMMNGGPLMSETPLNVGMICTSLIFAGIGAILFSDTVRRGVVI